HAQGYRRGTPRTSSSPPEPSAPARKIDSTPSLGKTAKRPCRWPCGLSTDSAKFSRPILYIRQRRSYKLRHHSYRERKDPPAGRPSDTRSFRGSVARKLHPALEW